MTDYIWPVAVNVANVSLTWDDNSLVFISPLSNSTRTESRPGSKWLMSIALTGLVNKSLQNNPLHEIEAFLLRLNGKEHRAIIPDFSYRRSGPGGGDPRVDGPSQTGLTLNTYGWPNSTTVLYAGDRIGVSNQMIPVVDDVVSNATGFATLNLAAPIRQAPVTASQIEIDAPTARFILQSKASFNAQPGITKSMTLQFEEDVL